MATAQRNLVGWPLCLLSALAILSVACTKPPQPTGGGVHGSLYALAGVSAEGLNAKPYQAQIVLPDIKVYLHNTDTAVDSAPVVTDLFGRYLFPVQPPGHYVLRWDAQLGWAAGQHPTPIVIGSSTQYPVPARVAPDKLSGVIYGRVTFADSNSPWFYDELFSEKHTAAVTILNMARTLTLAGPIHANALGWYAVAGVPRGSDVTVRVQAEAVTVMRLVSSAALSFGGAVALTNVQLPNHKPEILTVVTESGGAFVRTAPGGAAIQLRALTRDLDGDVLNYTWRVLPGEGSLAPATGSTVQWTLPAEAANHSVYLEVKDGRGGYARHRVDFAVDRTTTTFSGRVIDRKTNAPVGGADVSVNGTPATTSASGFFLVQAPLTKRYVFNITKTGYALFSRVVDAGETGQTWRLVPAQVQVVDPSKPIELVDRRSDLKQRKGVTVRVPAGALVDSSGNKPSGPLKAYLVTYDIAGGEAPGDWGALRGDKETNLISFGAGFVEFVDVSGTRYNLAPGSEGEVEITPPASMMAGGGRAGVAMWSYEEADGYWKEAGEVRLVGGKYVGKVRHFSAFNTDLALDEAACLKVLLYPPLPTGVRLQMTDPTGVNFTQTFEFVLDRPLRGIYRVPANIDVRLKLFDPDGNEYGNLVLEEIPGTPLPNDIVNSGLPIPSGETLWPDEPYDTCKLVILRLDIAANPSIFLTFKGEGTDTQAGEYYDAVDPDKLRENLGEWWQTNGFTLGANGWPLDATNGDPSVIRTSYLNNNDLGSGRDMYFRDLGGGQMAAFVTNYGQFNQDAGNADLAAARAAPGATVCMEYSPVEHQGSTPIVKFFVYAGADFKANAPLQRGAELDGFGVKYVPNLCNNCHGGSYFPNPATPDGLDPTNPGGPNFAEINMGARFRELDTATYKFPAGATVPNAGEKIRFKSQNQLIANAGSGAASQAIRDLIANWYPGASTDQDNTWEPGGWSGSPRSTLYDQVVKNSCRTCHVAFDDDTTPGGNNWTTYDQLKLRNSGGTLKSIVLCDNRFMPHAVITYRNFWLSSPHQPGVLRTYADGANWTAIGECP
jgi:hypothetical protein